MCIICCANDIVYYVYSKQGSAASIILSVCLSMDRTKSLSMLRQFSSCDQRHVRGESSREFRGTRGNPARMKAMMLRCSRGDGNKGRGTLGGRNKIVRDPRRNVLHLGQLL